MSVLGPVRTVKARIQHNCFLCPLPIAPRSRYLTWAWKGGTSVTTMRVHPSCESYAQSHIDGWTNGDGVEENSVETDIGERVAWRGTYNASEADDIVKMWPDLAPLVERASADVRGAK